MKLAEPGWLCRGDQNIESTVHWKRFAFACSFRRGKVTPIEPAPSIARAGLDWTACSPPAESNRHMRLALSVLLRCYRPSDRG
jgi:hypothetical protein